MEWLKQLRMASLRKSMVQIVLFLVLAVGVFVYFHCWQLFGMLSPKTLWELSPETMEGAYVEDDIYWIYTPYIEERYGETWASGSTTGIQYLIDLDDVYYLGMSVHKDKLDEAEALMQAVDDYWDGKISEDDVPVMHVTGTIKKMDEEERGYYHDLADGDEELISVMPPYYLDVGRIGGQPFWMEVVIFIGTLVLLVIALFPLVKSLRGGYQKKVLAKLRESGSFEAAAERAAQFYEMTEPVCGVRMNGEYVFFQDGANSVLLRPWDVAWAYQSTTQHRTNGIPTGKSFAAILRTMDGTQYTLGMKEEQVRRLLEAISVSLPGVVLGYTEELEQVYKQNRNAFRERWEEKMPGCTGSNSYQ